MVYIKAFQRCKVKGQINGLISRDHEPSLDLAGIIRLPLTG